MRRALVFTFILCLIYMIGKGQEIVVLYPEGAPGLIRDGVEELAPKEDGITRISNVTVPTIAIFIPENKTSDAAVIICSGGGYGVLAYDHEGTEIAEWFNQQGMTAVVLKSRLPEKENFENPGIRPLQDAQTAIRYIRKNADRYGIDTGKIGIMGFSAGGHLAATASTLYDRPVGEIIDNTVSLRPDFSVLMYPVIHFDNEHTHIGSRDNLLGENPSEELKALYSPYKQVTSDTPPVFLISTEDDFVSPENSISYFLACKKHGVPATMHIYDKGGHGYALKDRDLGLVQTWPDRLEEWLRAKELIK